MKSFEWGYRLCSVGKTVWIMNLPSRLPPDLQARHTALYKVAVEEARKKGWDPELGDDD